MIIDAKEMIVGRIGTVAAKKALLGEKIDIINCESAVITGSRDYLVGEWKRRSDQGTYQRGPFIARMPDRFVRRIIRGMLPYKQTKGKTAFGNIMCYNGVPKEFAGKETLKIEDAHISKMNNKKYMTVGEICKKLGQKLEVKNE